MPTSCPTITNTRGNTNASPCSWFCGPLDVAAWQETANIELQRAAALRGRMSDAERSELDRLAALARDLPIGFDGPVIQLANVAHAAQCLALIVGNRPTTPPTTPPPAQPPTAPGGGGGWDLPDFPGLPDGFNLDSLFGGLGKVLPWVVIGLVLLVSLKGKR